MLSSKVAEDLVTNRPRRVCDLRERTDTSAIVTSVGELVVSDTFGTSRELSCDLIFIRAMTAGLGS